MPVEVIMPKVDMDMEKGKLSSWHVAEGETVTKGAPLFDIETDKAAMEVESPATGRLHHVVASAGATVAVGLPVAWIYAEGEAVGAAPPGAAPAPAEPAVAAATPAAAASVPAAARSCEAPCADPRATRATPAARRLARDGGVALAAIAGSGPNGRIQRADVESLLERPAAAPASARAEAPALAAEPAPAAWTSEAGELFVSRRKGTGTPLLLLHGFAADSTGWLPLERELPADLPLVRIDLPSHGRSPRRRVRDFAELAREVRTAFDRAIDGPVHVLAHSLGGALALALADVRPRDVASLTLLAPAGLGPEIDGGILNGIARASRAESLAPWLKRLTARPDTIGWDFARAAMLARTDPEMRAAQLDLADAIFPDGVQAFDMTAALERLALPATIVWGRGDHVIPWRHALNAPGEIALHLLREVGHIPHVECPALVAELVMQRMGQAHRR